MVGRVVWFSVLKFIWSIWTWNNGVNASQC